MSIPLNMSDKETWREKSGCSDPTRRKCIRSFGYTLKTDEEGGLHGWLKPAYICATTRCLDLPPKKQCPHGCSLVCVVSHHTSRISFSPPQAPTLRAMLRHLLASWPKTKGDITPGAEKEWIKRQKQGSTAIRTRGLSHINPLIADGCVPEGRLGTILDVF